MGIVSKGLKAAEEVVKAAEVGTKEAKSGFWAAAEATKASPVDEAAKIAAEKQAKIEAGLAKKGSIEGRIGIKQRELDALKQQTVGRSGEKGWQNLTGEFRARLEEGGEFPLRFSRTPAKGGEGAIRPLGRGVAGETRSLERTAQEHLPRINEYRGRGQYYPPAGPELGSEAATKAVPGLKSAVSGRAARGEEIARESISGIPAAADQPVARSAGIEFSRKGQARGIRSISQGVTTNPEDAYTKLRKGIQSGAVRSIGAGVAGGYAAQGWGESSRDLYTGPDNSHRTPTVQWGRNRQ